MNKKQAKLISKLFGANLLYNAETTWTFEGLNDKDNEKIELSNQEEALRLAKGHENAVLLATATKIVDYVLSLKQEQLTNNLPIA